MSAATTLFFLFAIVAGQGDAASLTTLGEFPDPASCSTAQHAVEAAVAKGTALAHLFCVASDDLEGFAKAAR